MRILSILAVAVLSVALSSCKGFNPADATRIASESYDLYKDIKDTAAKAKADAKATQDVQPTAMLLTPVENAPPVRFSTDGLPAVCAFDPGPLSGVSVASSESWHIAFSVSPP